MTVKKYFFVFEGSHAGDLLKGAAEVVNGGEATGIGNSAYGSGAFGEQLFCVVDPCLQDILSRCYLVGFLKKLSEIYFADSRAFCQARIGKLGIGQVPSQVFHGGGKNVMRVCVFSFLGKLGDDFIKDAHGFRGIFGIQPCGAEAFKIFQIPFRMGDGDFDKFICEILGHGKINNGKISCFLSK